MMMMMMRGAMEAESDVITVHLSQQEDGNVLTGRLIDAASLDGHAWASLIEECRSSDQENFTSLSFLLSRQMYSYTRPAFLLLLLLLLLLLFFMFPDLPLPFCSLMQKSSFFRSLLGGDFRQVFFYLYLRKK